MSKNKYSNIGKKQIIGVISQLIHKIESIEMTLNIFIEFMDKENNFQEFMKTKLGCNNELQSNDSVNGEENNPNTNEDSCCRATRICSK